MGTFVDDVFSVYRPTFPPSMAGGFGGVGQGRGRDHIDMGGGRT